MVNMRNARLSKPWREKYKKIIQLFLKQYYDTLDCIRFRDHGL